VEDQELDNTFKVVIAEMMDIAVDSILQVLRFDEQVEHFYTQNLEKEQAEEIIFWFDDEVIPLYNELKLFEKAENAEKIKNIIKKHNENIH